MLSYNRGILYSKAICDFLSHDNGLMRDYHLFVETFNNCRENGYVLTAIYDGYGEAKSPLYIWIHEHRNSEACVIRWGTYDDYADNEKHIYNMYSEKIYNEQTECFDNFNPKEIADFIAEKIKEYFEGARIDRKAHFCKALRNLSRGTQKLLERQGEVKNE